MKDKETLYARWLSNEINEEELTALKKEGAIDDLERIINTTEGWEIPAYDKKEGLKKLKSKRDTKQPKVRRLFLKWSAGIAASFLVLFSVFNFYNQNAKEEILAEQGRNEKLNLADGSSVILNDGSSLTYNKNNWLKDRSIDLRGEAYFEVEKGSPFVVNTKNGSIEVLGTKFSVRAWGDKLYVECYEGKVQVRSKAHKTILTAKESINVANKRMDAKGRIAYNSPLWQNGTSRFYNEQLKVVFEELGRQYGVEIFMETLDDQFSGSFSHDNLVNALRSICVPLGLKYRINDENTAVYIERQ